MLLRTIVILYLIFHCVVIATADEFEFDIKQDVYVVGDIHGAFKEFTQTLTTVGLIDDENNWAGGSAHLVSLGDLLDRGPNSRAVVDLLRKLQTQAAKAGGRVHVVLGNHEIMNLQGDWRYLSKEEISAFAAEESERDRKRAYNIYLRSFRIDDSEEHRANFNASYPPGFFAHIKAYHRNGDYGEWVMDQPFIIRINNNLFTHGGLSPKVADMSLEEINEEQSDNLTDYLRVWEHYLDEQVLSFNVPFSRRPDFVVYTRKDRYHRTFMRTHTSLLFSPDSTTWYRGNALCHPYFEEDRLKTHLDDLESTRLWVGHTTTRSKMVETRLSGALVIMDTGMLGSYYRGEPWIAKISPDNSLTFVHGQSGETGTALVSPVRNYVNPYRWSDKRVEQFLQTAEIVEIENTIDGTTRPLRLTLKQGKRKVKAIFKYVDTNPDAETQPWSDDVNNADRYQYEVAAYKLDRMLGIGLVPVTVEREVNGMTGVVQLWIDNLISFTQLDEQGISYNGMCDYKGQINFMDSFDYLIANKDRNQSNIHFSESDFQIWFIDHSMAFSTRTERPEMMSGQDIKVTPRFKRALKELSDEQIASLGTWLHERQLEALANRRDKMLRGDF